MKKTSHQQDGGASSGEPHRVLVLEDHCILRAGLVHFLNQEPDFSVCAEADDGRVGLRLAEKHKPDVVISKIDPPGLNGLAFLKNLKSILPKICAVVLGARQECIYVERALRAGASVYMLKNESFKQVLSAIRDGLKGRVTVSPPLANRVCKEYFIGNSLGKNGINALSDREMAVFEMIGHGMSRQEIAQLLGLSSKTIDAYKERIKVKLNIDSSRGLTRMALEHFGLRLQD